MDRAEKIIFGDNLLAKYVMKRKELRADGRLKSASLSRSPPNALSFMEVDDLTHAEICEHGRKYVDDPSIGRVHVGYCLFKAEELLKLGLQVKYDNRPERHVSVFFPEDLDKRKRLGKQLEAKCLNMSLNGQAAVYFHPCD